MIVHAIVLVSVALLLVTVKLVPTTFAEMRRNPGVPPSTWDVRNMRLLAVTDVLATVTVPPTKTAVPILALVPVLT